MFKILGAAVAAISLFATSASAATVLVSFEDGQLGTQYDSDIDGMGVFTPGLVVGDANNKSMLLSGLTEAEFFAYGWGKFYTPEGRGFLHAFSLISFDVFIPAGGDYTYMGREGGSIAPGQWVTVTRISNASDDDCRYYCKYVFHGAGVQLDNLRFEHSLAAIPEPATWAMLIAGFGLAGAWLRRSRPAFC